MATLQITVADEHVTRVLGALRARCSFEREDGSSSDTLSNVPFARACIWHWMRRIVEIHEGAEAGEAAKLAAETDVMTDLVFDEEDP